jgi:hypothetical protein
MASDPAELCNGDRKEPKEPEYVDDSTSPDVDARKPDEWRSCCFNVDRRVIMFFTNALFSLILALFCIYQLAAPEIPEARFTLYISLLTGTVNLWMPGPKIK